MPSRAVFVSLARAQIVVALAVAGAAAAARADGDARGFELRVESELFADGAAQPVARSLTLFRAGVAWDFLELAAPDDKASAGGMRLAEIVLHDPIRERVVVIDPNRDVKTQVETIRLERLSVSLAKWARSADDRLVRWAGGPDFGDGITEKEDALESVRGSAMPWPTVRRLPPRRPPPIGGSPTPRSSSRPCCTRAAFLPSRGWRSTGGSRPPARSLRRCRWRSTRSWRSSPAGRAG
jgi:hypothetical protein